VLLVNVQHTPTCIRGCLLGSQAKLPSAGINPRHPISGGARIAA